MNCEFLPVSRSDVKQRGWDRLDIILITGDAYVDHPAYGAAQASLFTSTGVGTTLPIGQSAALEITELKPAP